MATAVHQAISACRSHDGFCCSSSSRSSPSTRVGLDSNFAGSGRVSLMPHRGGRGRSGSRRSGALTVEAAISRSKKEATVEKAREQLEGAQLVAAISYVGLSVKQLQRLRQVLPATSSLIVAKNTLIGKAIEGTEWEALKPVLKGMNAWLFVHSDEIPASIKPYRQVQSEFKLETDFAGAVFEGKFYGPEEVKELESMPTRAELFSKLLGSVQSPATNLVGTLQGPARNLVFTLKAYVAKLEEEAGQAPQ